MSKPSPFRYFKTWLKIIRPTVMMYVLFPLSLRKVEDLLHERGKERLRHGTSSVKQVRTNVRGRDPAEEGQVIQQKSLMATPLYTLSRHAQMMHPSYRTHAMP